MTAPSILAPIAIGLLLTGCSTLQQTASPPGFVPADAGIRTDRARSGGWADYDGDGCIDLLITQAGGPVLYHNDCRGRFSDVTTSAGLHGPAGGMGVAWADYDGDGDPDAYIASTDGPNALYRNDGDGTFTEVAAAAGVDDPRASTTATWGDYDRDGDLDLFVANRFYPRADSDITDRLYRNDGNGRFTDVGVASGAAVKDRKTFSGAWFDADGNGTLDLYLAVDFGDDQLLLNDGRGHFRRAGPGAGISGPAHAMGLAIGDIDGNGCLDVVSTNNTRGRADDREHGPSTLYLNDCSGHFSDATTRWGIADRGTVDWGVNLVDWDGDGDLDLAIVSGGMLKGGENETNVLYENRDGRLYDVTDSLGAAVTGAAFGSAWADYDNDGDLDWLVVNSRRNSVLLQNRSGSGHTLVVKLRGRGANRDGIGALVTATVAGRERIRLIQAGSGYGSTGPPVARFGLGSGDRIEHLRVDWPDGRVTTLTGVPEQSTLTIRQP
ncbi:MAG TPA: hypothetical protein ENI96_01835 [Sedimenticola thiotaurini]|uniref:ASPIC/UnbV domain-containing protein n=1 Tax=Sedimenticola thiotaurini TaxID=1543721 RepID=A0A831RLN0_9GAMM|nr:hypothetical protein [Sedimenticola thiotaurini]